MHLRRMFLAVLTGGHALDGVVPTGPGALQCSATAFVKAALAPPSKKGSQSFGGGAVGWAVSECFALKLNSLVAGWPWRLR